MSARCSSSAPHAAHTFGGRPMQFCEGIPAEPVAGEAKQGTCRSTNICLGNKPHDKCDECYDWNPVIGPLCAYCGNASPIPGINPSGNHHAPSCIGFEPVTIESAPAVAAPGEGKQQIKRDLGQTVAEKNAMTSKKLLHEYLSTACYHGFHEACRIHCKFCSEKCSCKCHTEEDARRIVEAVNGRS